MTRRLLRSSALSERWWLALLLAAASVGCSKNPAPPQQKPVRILAGAGLRPAVDELIAAFGRRTGIRVVPDYGGSGMILTRAKMGADADLFLPGDVWYVQQLHEQAQLIERQKPVAYFVPVIVTPKGDTRVGGLPDLFTDGLRVALGNPKACQVGRISRKILRKNGLDPDKLDAKLSITVNELGVWVKAGGTDATIVWDAIAANLAPDVRVVPIPPEQNIISRVVVGLLTRSERKDRAGKFVDFITGPAGQAILKAKGYRVTPPPGGDEP